ncbi:NAD(P)-dependent oxidoreductase, partial [Amycolatopsis sp. SID8362]|uniref:NAD-dependent epimerase/dehydratase family protein n=1 Tax=Amycolatopsis sp. SID8362 TaxID=2690346 RepID=UPI00136ECCBD
MRILVIGASGFLGGHVRRAAAARGIEVIAPAHDVLDLAAGSAEPAALIAKIAPRAVVNCAGAVTGDAAAMNATNVVGTENLVRAIGPGVRLVHLGSAAEYGRGSPGVPVTEAAVPQPLTPYGVTKLGGTRIVADARESGLDGVVLRV